jgi:DNA-binding NarL/FixJ family response regulator
VIAPAGSEEAIELASASRPDAALVDVVMPNGGGIRAVRGILEVAPRTAIVMLSAYKSKGTVRQLLEVGVFSYCRKRLEPRQLVRALNESIAVHFASRTTRCSYRPSTSPRRWSTISAAPDGSPSPTRLRLP